MAYTDVFAILCLINNTMVIIFLVIAAIYFYNLTNFNIPSSGTSLFLFGVSLLLAFVCLILGLYAVWKIFSYRPLTVIETTAINTNNSPIQTTMTNSVVTTPNVEVANLYAPYQMRNIIGNPVSDIPLTIIPPPSI